MNRRLQLVVSNIQISGPWIDKISSVVNEGVKDILYRQVQGHIAQVINQRVSSSIFLSTKVGIHNE